MPIINRISPQGAGGPIKGLIIVAKVIAKRVTYCQSNTSNSYMLSIKPREVSTEVPTGNTTFLVTR